MEIITSRNNRKIVDICKLKAKKYRDDHGLFYFEGVKLLKEAIAFGVGLAEVFICEDSQDIADILPDGMQYTVVSRAVYEKLTDENAPQGVFCVAYHLDKLHKSAKIYERQEHSPALLLENVRDPGNLGTILRTAYAFGIGRLILSSDCADIYNPKTIRAAMGAVFRQPTVRADDIIKTVDRLKCDGISVYAAVLNEHCVDIRDINIAPKDICFAVGNEGHGLSAELVEACSGSVIIPMRMGCESLNVAGAATVLMWELMRKRLD